MKTTKFHTNENISDFTVPIWKWNCFRQTQNQCLSVKQTLIL